MIVLGQRGTQRSQSRAEGAEIFLSSAPPEGNEIAVKQPWQHSGPLSQAIYYPHWTESENGLSKLLNSKACCYVGRPSGRLSPSLPLATPIGLKPDPQLMIHDSQY